MNSFKRLRTSLDCWTAISGLDAVTDIGSVLELEIGPQNRLWVAYPDAVAILEGETLLCGEAFACPTVADDSNTIKGLSANLDDQIWVYSDVGARQFDFDAAQTAIFRGPEVFGLTGADDLWVLGLTNLYRVDEDLSSVRQGALVPARS